MPIILKNKTYTDSFGNSGSTYVSNAGDQVTLELVVSEKIRITTINNPFTFDPLLFIFTSPAKSWLDEGFRVGDFVHIERFDSAGSSTASGFAVATAISDTELNVSFWPAFAFYDISAGEIMVITATTNGTGTPIPRLRADLTLEFNHSLDTEIANTASLIDGELSRIYFNDLSSLSIGSFQTGNLVGNQSGQFILSAGIQRDGFDSDGFNQFTIQIVFINSGIYDQSNFALGQCLKAIIKGLWSSKPGETFKRSPFTLDEQANTGWFNEANNSSVATGGSVISTFSELKYNVNPNTGLEFEIDLAGTNSTDIGIGGAYVSLEDSYYKNRIDNQKNITYALPTVKINPGTTYGSFDGLGSASQNDWKILINSVSTSGGNATVNFDFIPRSGFSDFIESRDPGDRIFYLWVRIGNTNHLLYSKDLVKELPVGGPLTMINDFGFLDHSQNIESISGINTGFSADTEDDLAYYGTFNLEKNKTTYFGLNLRIEAYNTTTQDSFVLQQTNFSFGGVTYQSSTGKYLLNESATINSELPTTSKKRQAKVDLTGVDSATDYEVEVYYPFLLNWKYWLDLLGVNSDFAPNENQNWEQYSNVNWDIRMHIELNDNNLAFTHSNTLIDKPYDNSPFINSTIELKKQSDNSVITIIPDGELLFIESTHILVSGVWDITKIWGMITIEPKESAPRSICSTIIPYDNDLTNPLSPISGLLCQVTYPNSITVKFKCKFDPSKIDTTNGVKITAKIKQGLTSIVEIGKATTNDDDKNTTSDELKVLA